MFRCFRRPLPRPTLPPPKCAQDHIIQIPHALMMSDFHAKADPDFGHVHRLNTPLLVSDSGLVIYIMQEILKEDKSFYWPYLRVLPTPHNLRSWSGEDLLLLQDNKLVRRVAARRRQLRALYHETIEYLSNTYPELYSASAVLSSQAHVLRYVHCKRRPLILRRKTMPAMI